MCMENLAGARRNGGSAKERSCECEEENRHGEQGAEATRTQLPEEGATTLALVYYLRYSIPQISIFQIQRKLEERKINNNFSS